MKQVHKVLLSEMAKEFKNHLLSMSVFGAPQQHDQRKYQTGIAVFDSDYADEQELTLNL